MSATDTRMETIENATLEDVRAGDHLTWKWVQERNGVTLTETREGIAHHRDEDGDWCTKGGSWITECGGEWDTLTIRRPAQELPKSVAMVIVPNDGYEAVEAWVGGFVWRASEAVLGVDGRWHGVWRTGLGGRALSSVAAVQIISPTWKVDDA